jgi:hypothetical protein
LRQHRAFLGKFFRGGGPRKAFLDEPKSGEITPGITRFCGVVAGPDPIAAMTIEVGDHKQTVSVFHARADVREATGAAHAAGWQLYVHLPAQPPGRESLKVRILVDGICLLERTLVCVGNDRPQVVLEEPTHDQITAGVVRLRGLVSGPDPISSVTVEVGNRSEVISTFDDRADVLEAGGSTRAAGFHLHVHVPPACGDSNTPQVRILVAGTCLLEQTYVICHRRAARVAMPLLFFMHIPKTAGTSLRVAIGAQPERLQSVCVYPDDQFITTTRCLEIGAAAFNDVDLIFGHFPYGFHTISNRSYRYMTVVRDPFSMIKSYYLYAKYVQRRPYMTACSSIYEAMIKERVVELDNSLVRHFSNRIDPYPISEDDLLIAQQNIRRDFLYVGTTENMRKSVRKISEIVGFEIDLLHLNKTDQSKIMEQIDDLELRSRLKNDLAFDLRLYDWIADQRY